MAQHIVYLRFLDSEGNRTFRGGEPCLEKKLNESWERMIQKNKDKGGSVDIVWDEEPAWWHTEQCDECGKEYAHGYTQGHISVCRVGNCSMEICEECRFNPCVDEDGDMTYMCIGCHDGCGCDGNGCPCYKGEDEDEENDNE